MEQGIGIERSSARKQFVKQHAERVDVAARIDVEAGHECLLGTHVSRGADELLVRSENGFVRQPLVRRGLRDPKIDDLRHRYAVIDRYQNVRRLQIAMDDSLLMRVLHGVANLNKQIQAFPRRKLRLIAIIGNANATDQFHHEEGTAGLRRTGIKDLGDVWVVHERQRLPLDFESADDRFGIHPELDDF